MTTAAATVYTSVTSERAAKKAQSKAEKFREEELESREQQAGEYYQLSAQQMELQSQASQIKTLANLITEAKQPAAPQVFTLPAAKEYSAVEQLNRAIDKIVRG